MLSFKDFLLEDAEDSGSKSSFRGKLNELAFVHAFDRYHQLLKQHGNDHEKAIIALSGEGHLNHKTLDDKHPFKKDILAIKDKIGDQETDRTLWDSHHAALTAINHIHKNSGGITGAPVWAGGDASGEKTRQITGYNTPADLVVPTKKGWSHLSLKYSEKTKDSPTKLSQRTADQIVEHVQDVHEKNFGKRDQDLDDKLQELKKSFGTSSLEDEDIKKKLLGAGFELNKNGQFSKSKLNKLGRYASTLKGYDENDQSDRASKLRNTLRDHFESNGIPQQEHAKHIKNLADIYDNVLKSGKKKSSVSFMDSLHNSVKRIYNEGSSGQHGMIKNILNINPPGNDNFLVVKTQRSAGDYETQPEQSMPKTAVANHSQNIDDHIKDDTENQAYDSIKSDNTSTTTISRKKGKNIARLSIDTSKSVPTIVSMAGDDIDKFSSISHHHPSKDTDLGSTSSPVSTSSLKLTPQTSFSNWTQKEPPKPSGSKPRSLSIGTANLESSSEQPTPQRKVTPSVPGSQNIGGREWKTT